MITNYPDPEEVKRMVDEEARAEPLGGVPDPITGFIEQDLTMPKEERDGIEREDWEKVTEKHEEEEEKGK